MTVNLPATLFESKTGGSSLWSISDIAQHQHLKDNNDEDIAPKEMLQELRARTTCNSCDSSGPRMKFAIATMM